MKKIVSTIVILGLLMGIVGAIILSRSTKNEIDNSLGYILEKKTFILGLDDSFPPMGFRNDKNEIVGYDIDIAKEVCNRIGVELKLQPISWAAKQQELDSKNIDCIWNGMSIDEERKNAMNLSMPYMENSMVLVVKKEAEYIKIEDLYNKKIGVQSGSTAQKILEQNDIYNKAKETIGYGENILAFKDLEIGQIEAVFVDEVLANYYINSQNKAYKLIQEELAKEEYSIGFRKKDETLKNKIEEVLIDMKKDGTLEAISKKWFGKDVSIIKTGN